MKSLLHAVARLNYESYESQLVCTLQLYFVNSRNCFGVIGRATHLQQKVRFTTKVIILQRGYRRLGTVSYLE